MFSAGLIRFHRVSRLLECCVLIVALQSVSCGSGAPPSKDCKCFKVEDDGFFSKRYNPQPQQDQDVGDQCIKIDDCKPTIGVQYREYDGRCNNERFPMWGKSGNGLVRLLPPKYGDGISSPRKAEDGGDLPNERLIRTTVLPSKSIKDKKISYWFSVFGQWISHDTARTDTSTSNGDCCGEDGKTWPGSLPENCTSSRIFENDEFYSKFGVTCLTRTRSLITDDFGCNLQPRQLWNPVTAYVDSSDLYGSDAETAKTFMAKERGQLVTSKVDNREFPKLSAEPRESCDIRDGDKPVCFTGGDPRASQNPPLTVIATIFNRFHNDFAEKLSKLRPDWDDRTIFEETRRIVIGVTQLILRKEWLPKFIGQDFMDQAGMTFKNTELDELYNPLCNAGTLAEFMHSAYRGGHSTIVEALRLQEGKETRNLVINDWLLRPGVAVDHYDAILKSAVTCPMAKQDKWFSFNMNNKIFKGKAKWGSDLETTTIARGREAGFGGYVHYLETLLQEPKINSWDDLKKYFTEDTLASLKKVYKSFRDIDMYVGGVVECPVGDSLFGKMFTAICADQFARWLLCDRHSPTLKGGPGAFTLPQLKELNKCNMAYLICKYSDNLETVPSNPFDVSSQARSDIHFDDDYSTKPAPVNFTDVDEDRTFQHVLQGHQVQKPQIEKPEIERPPSRSKSIDCRSLPDIDLSPWKKTD